MTKVGAAITARQRHDLPRVDRGRLDGRVVDLDGDSFLTSRRGAASALCLPQQARMRFGRPGLSFSRPRPRLCGCHGSHEISACRGASASRRSHEIHVALRPRRRSAESSARSAGTPMDGEMASEPPPDLSRLGGTCGDRSLGLAQRRARVMPVGLRANRSNEIWGFEPDHVEQLERAHVSCSGSARSPLRPNRRPRATMRRQRSR